MNAALPLLFLLSLPAGSWPQDAPTPEASPGASAEGGTAGAPTQEQAPAFDARGDAPPELVKRGLRHFEAGEPQLAAAAFEAAAAAVPAGPPDPILSFDRGCALMAASQFEEARGQFMAAALARDASLAAAARYNLGLLSAAQAREKLGPDPIGVEPAAREGVIADLEEGIRRFHTCLEIDPEHEDARYNLELLRLYRKQLEDLWKQQDQAQQQEGENLAAMLSRMMEEEEALRDVSDLQEEEKPTPRRSEALREAAGQQRGLAAEMDPLKEKLVQELTPPDPQAQGVQPGQPPAPQLTPEQQQQLDQALAALQQLADAGAGAMQQAAEQLEAQAPDEAEQSQAAAVDNLENMFRGVAPFESLLQQAIKQEEALLGVSEQRTEPLPEGIAEEEKTAAGVPEAERLAHRQGFVAAWAGLLEPHARQRLSQLEAAQAAPRPASPDPGANGPTPEQLQAVQQQQDALRQALEKALENGPRASEIAGRAQEPLGGEGYEDAAALQKEALELLKEIDELMPKDQNSQQDQGKDNPNQEKQDQDEDAKQKNDQEREQPQEDPSAKEEKPQEPRQQDLSREQAERLLQRAKEREQEYKKLQEELMRLLGRAPVSKDW